MSGGWAATLNGGCSAIFILCESIDLPLFRDVPNQIDGISTRVLVGWSLNSICNYLAKSRWLFAMRLSHMTFEL